MKSIFPCKVCGREIDLFKIKTQKQIDDLHKDHLCADCSDGSPILIKRRKTNV